MKNDHYKTLKREIQEIGDFTASYWIPLYEECAKNPEGKNMEEIVWNIIKSRENYVRKLEDKLEEIKKCHA